MNAGLKQLEKLYADAGLGKIEWTQRNHNSWMTLKQRPNSGVVDKNYPQTKKRNEPAPSAE